MSTIFGSHHRAGSEEIHQVVDTPTVVQGVFRVGFPPNFIVRVLIDAMCQVTLIGLSIVLEDRFETLCQITLTIILDLVQTVMCEKE